MPRGENTVATVATVGPSPGRCLTGFRSVLNERVYYDLPNWKEIITLSTMENHSTEPSQEEATNSLNTISADRDRLAASVHIPWALLAALGALGAWWVAAAATTNPGENYVPPTSGWLALLGVLVVVHLIRRETGVRFRAMGARAGWALVGIVAVCLALFSISLGFVSFGLWWPVVLTSLAAFAATTWLAGIAYRSAVARLGRE